MMVSVWMLFMLVVITCWAMYIFRPNVMMDAQKCRLATFILAFVGFASLIGCILFQNYLRGQA